MVCCVFLDTVIFSASDFLHLTEKLQLDLHEPPMSQVSFFNIWKQCCGSVPLTNGSDSFLHWCKKKYLFLPWPKAHHLQSKKLNYLLKCCAKILFCGHYFSPLSTFMRKGKDPGGRKTCRIRIRFRIRSPNTVWNLLILADVKKIFGKASIRN